MTGIIYKATNIVTGKVSIGQNKYGWGVSKVLYGIQSSTRGRHFGYL